jgi:hypothetical protein
MLTKTKFVLAAAIVLSAPLAASATTNARVTDDQVAAYNTIPGYDSNGQTVGIPNPDRQPQR